MYLYHIFLCSVQKSYRATRHQWQFPQFAAAAFKFNSTSIQTHVVAATIQKNTEYRRILTNTWMCYEAKHSNHQIQLDIDLMPRCCSSHQETLQNFESRVLWKSKCIAKLKNPPTKERRTRRDIKVYIAPLRSSGCNGDVVGGSQSFKFETGNTKYKSTFRMHNCIRAKYEFESSH